MAVNLIRTSKKLMQAISIKTDRQLMFAMKQIMGREQKPVTLYIISESVFNPETGKYQNVEVYSSSSMVRIVLYLRDVWYLLNGMELPVDQEKWNSIREELLADGKYWA